MTAPTIPDIVCEALAATFEQRPGFLTLVAAAVRAIDPAIPLPAAAVQDDARDAARYRWLVAKAFDIEFITDDTLIATSYSYSGSDEGFAKWVTSHIDSAMSLPPPPVGENE